MADEQLNGASADAEADEKGTEVSGEESATEGVGLEPGAEATNEVPAAEAEAELQPEALEEAPGAGAEADAGAAPQSASTPKKKRLPRALRPQRAKPKREPTAKRKPVVRLEKPVRERGRNQERQGTVVSSAMEKTIVVKVDVIKAHPKYKKVVRRSTTFHAHDERNEAKVGDVVRIVETRPLSKTKRWRLAEIVEVAK